MGSNPNDGTTKMASGSQAAVPAEPLDAEPLPDPEPGEGGNALGAGNPVPPPQGWGASPFPAGATGVVLPAGADPPAAAPPAGAVPGGEAVPCGSGRTRTGVNAGCVAA